MATNATSSKRSTAKHGGPFLWALSFIPLWLRNRQNLGTREPVLFLSLASARAEHLASRGCRPSWPSHAPLSLPVYRRLMTKHPNCDSMCPLRIALGVARCSSRPPLFALAADMSTWPLRT